MAAAIPLIVGVGTAVATTSIVIGAAVGLATALVMDNVTQPDIPDVSAVADTISGRNVSTKKVTKAREIIYGEVRKGGNIVYEVVHGTDNVYLTQIFAICQGEIRSVDHVYFGDEEVWEVGAGLQGDWRSGEEFSGHLLVNTKVGQTYEDSYYVVNVNEWSTLHRLNGVASAMVRFRFGTDAYPNGVPKVTFIVRGMKVYDPRTNESNTTETIKYYRTNPVLCLYDYLRSSKYGAGLDRDMFDMENIKNAANWCDANMSDGTKRFECHGVLNTKTSIRENIKKLLTCMMGQLVYHDGKFLIYPYQYRSVNDSIVIDERVLTSSFVVSNAIPRRQQYNLVKGEYVSKHANYVATEYPPQTDATYVSNDGGKELPLNLNLPFTTDTKHAQRLAKLMLKKSRRLRTAKFSMNATGYELALGDNVKISNEKLGYDEKVFEITRLTTKITGTTGMEYDIECRENDSEYYDISSFTPVDFSQETVDLPTTSAANRVDNVVHSFVMKIIEGKPRTVWSLTWMPPEGTIVDRYAISVGDSTVSTRHYEKFQTVERVVDYVVPEDVDSVKFVIYAINSKQKYSQKYEITQSVTQRWEDNSKYQDLLIGDPSVQPTKAQYKEIFGRNPQDGDSILVVEVDRDGTITASKRWTFTEQKLGYYMSTPTYLLERENEMTGEWKLTYSLSKDISRGADVTWSFTGTNFNTTLPVSSGKTDFDNVTLTVLDDPLGGMDIAEFKVTFPFSEWGGITPAGEQHQFLKDYTIYATFVDDSGVTQNYEATVTIGFLIYGE